MEERPVVNIIIGLDFGSSFTKVCYRLLGDRLDKKGVIEFSKNASEPQNVLLDSVVYATKDRRHISFYPFENSETLQFIKSDLTEQHKNPHLGDEVKELCAFFLGGVIGFARKYIELNEAKLLAGKVAVWILNIGIPVDQNEPHLEDAYQEIAKVAVLRSNLILRLKATILLSCWGKLYKASLSKDQDQMLVLLTSELLAEVVDVFEDPEVDQGISMIIDIGSATVDVAVVNLDRSSRFGYDLVYFVSAKVSLLGVDSLVKYIDKSDVEKITGNTKYALMVEEYYQYLRNLLNELDIDLEDMKHYGNSILSKFRGIIAETCLKVKKTEVRSVLSRQDTIPIYLLGGGSIYHWYKEWPQDAYTARLERSNIPKFKYQRLTRTPQFSQISSETFNRFRVASGLLKFETALRVSGYPWHFVPEEREREVTDYFRNRLEEMQKEQYGDF